LSGSHIEIRRSFERILTFLNKGLPVQIIFSLPIITTTHEYPSETKDTGNRREEETKEVREHRCLELMETFETIETME
jgi:hypothetical protein